MINVSNEFWKLMHERTDFRENAEITFADGTILELDEASFTISNNSVTDAAGVNSIPLGVALSRNIQIELMNDDKRFSTYDFFGAKIRLYLTFQLSESIEKIEYGTFTVVSPSTQGTTVIITANDDMHKADISYSTNITFPAQAWVVLQDSCATCGISLSTTEFLNRDFEIQEKPSSDYTHRQIIGYIAMIACGNARINRQGYLEILSYDFSFLNEIADGGTFNPWTGGYEADGGTFENWTEGDVLDGGLFTDRKNYHILYNFKDSPRVDTDDVVITGLQTVVQPKEGETESTTILLGQEGYVLKIENPLIATKEQEALQLIGATMIGGRMRKFEGDHIAYPIAEFMDKAFVVDREGNTYGTILTDVNFTFFGFTTFKNSAENAVRNASNFGSQGTQAIIQARKMVNAEKTARELSEQNMTKALVESSGLYFTKEKQEDGSEICYGHNKPTLEESDIVWKFTSGAIGISTDGGKTYSYGLTVTGELLANVLSVYGINADWIVTGIIRDATGKNYWNLENGTFTMTNGIMNVSGQVVFKAEDYTEEDITIAKEIVLGTREMTTEYLAKYDFTGKGYINAQDYIYMKKLIIGEATEYTLDVSVQINGLSQNNIIKTGGVSIGMNGLYSKNITADRINIKELRTLNSAGIECVGDTGIFETSDGHTLNIANGIVIGIF